MRVLAKAPGKCILFGEHAVVYRKPAIAAAINIYSICEIYTNNKKHIYFSLPDLNYNVMFENENAFLKRLEQDYHQYYIGLRDFQEKFKISYSGISIKITSDLWMGSGLGSSASTSLTLIKALSDFYRKSLSNEELIKIAYSMEKPIHGNPSGIDNTICALGGLIKYQNHQFNQLEFKENFWILIVYSNEPHQTKKAIEHVRILKKKNPSKIIHIFNSIEKITDKAINALNQQNLAFLVKLLQKNHQLLKKLNLSTPAMDEIIRILQKMGINGAKITGAGVGGCIIAISSSKAKLLIAQKELLSHQFPAIITDINHTGIKSEIYD